MDSNVISYKLTQKALRESKGNSTQLQKRREFLIQCMEMHFQKMMSKKGWSGTNSSNNDKLARLRTKANRSLSTHKEIINEFDQKIREDSRKKESKEKAIFDVLKPKTKKESKKKAQIVQKHIEKLQIQKENDWKHNEYFDKETFPHGRNKKRNKMKGNEHTKMRNQSEETKNDEDEGQERVKNESENDHLKREKENNFEGSNESGSMSQICLFRERRNEMEKNDKNSDLVGKQPKEGKKPKETDERAEGDLFEESYSRTLASSYRKTDIFKESLARTNSVVLNLKKNVLCSRNSSLQTFSGDDLKTAAFKSKIGLRPLELHQIAKESIRQPSGLQGSNEASTKSKGVVLKAGKAKKAQKTRLKLNGIQRNNRKTGKCSEISNEIKRLTLENESKSTGRGKTTVYSKNWLNVPKEEGSLSITGLGGERKKSDVSYFSHIRRLRTESGCETPTPTHAFLFLPGIIDEGNQRKPSFEDYDAAQNIMESCDKLQTSSLPFVTHHQWKSISFYDWLLSLF